MPDTQKLIQAIQNYTGDLESLNQFTATVQEQLGDNWVSVIYEACPNLDADDKERLDHAVGYHSATLAWEEIHGYLNQANQLDPALMAKRLPILEHWLNFFGPEGLHVVKALKERLQAEEIVETNHSNPNNSTAEEEVLKSPMDSEYKDSDEQLESEEISIPQEQNNIPVEQERDTTSVQSKASSHQTMADIPFMAQSVQESSISPREQAISQSAATEEATSLKSVEASSQKAQETSILQERSPVKPDVPTSTVSSEHTMGEQEYLWLADKIFLQITLMDQIHDWISARCHTLGNLELNEYAFNGFLTDVQRQTLIDIQALLAHPSVHPFLEQHQAGAINYLKQQQEFLTKTVAQSTSPAPLTKEDLTREEMQRTLGGIDTRHVKEYLGPAPDGFEVVNETFTEEEAKTIKENYEQAEAKVEASSSAADLNPEKALEQNPEKKGLRSMVLNIKPGDVT